MREVVVKIGLKQEEDEEGIVTEALLNSGATELVMSEEFTRRHKFKRTKTSVCKKCCWHVELCGAYSRYSGGGNIFQRT